MLTFLSCRRRLRSPTGYFFVFVLASSLLRALLAAAGDFLSAAMNTSRSAGSIGDVARLVRYLTSGSLRAGSVGSSALSLESLNVDLLGLIVFSVEVSAWEVSSWVVATAAACSAVLELSDEILDVKGVRL